MLSVAIGQELARLGPRELGATLRAIADHFEGSLADQVDDAAARIAGEIGDGSSVFADFLARGRQSTRPS